MKGIVRKSCGFIFLALIISAGVPVAGAEVSVGISVGVAPPPLPVYDQPVCPGDDYLWTPGYWAYGDDGYYWVPGMWVLAPAPYLLWTPGYWGWSGGYYAWHRGYWGRHVGFYGGINYGYGYRGTGYVGGAWRGGHFAYNRAVTHVNPARVHNIYSAPVAGGREGSRLSFNGGAGGTAARPSPGELAATHEQHVQATGRQMQHEKVSGGNRAMLASENHGQPLRGAVDKHVAAPATGRRSVAPAMHPRTGMPHGAGAPGTIGRSAVPAMHGQPGMPPSMHGQPGAPHGGGANRARPQPQHGPQEHERER